MLRINDPSAGVCKSSSPPRWVGWLASWLMCGTLAGCGGAVVQVTGSEEQVKLAVQQILEAWQSGDQLTEFATAHPELVVADEDWQAGKVLSAFSLPEPATLNGSHWRQKVELQLKSKVKGKPIVIYYAVTNGEKTSILRSDYQN